MQEPTWKPEDANLFGYSLFSGLLEGVMNSSGAHPGVEKLVLLTGLLVPTDQVFRRCAYELLGGSDLPFLSSANMGPFSIPSVPSDAFVLYTAGYWIVLLAWGCRAFSKKDM